MTKKGTKRGPMSEEHRRKIGDAKRSKKLTKPRKKYAFTKQHRANMSKVLMGHIVTEETKQKIGQGNRGKIRTGEHKRKLSESRKKLWADNPELRKRHGEKIKQWWAQRKAVVIT